MSKATGLSEFLNRNYPVRIYLDEADNLDVAEYVDLPGCHAYGDTTDEALSNAVKAKKEWLRLNLEEGFQIPDPSLPHEHSGRVLLRMPAELHSMLTDRAQLAGTSLNQFLVYLLSAGLVNYSTNQRWEPLQYQLDALRENVLEVDGRLSWLCTEAESRQDSWPNRNALMFDPASNMKVTYRPRLQIHDDLLDDTSAMPSANVTPIGKVAFGYLGK